MIRSMSLPQSRRLAAFLTLAFVVIATLAPLGVYAQDDPLQYAGNQIINYIKLIAPILIILGVMAAAIGIMTGHVEAWGRFVKVIVGGCLLVGATWFVTYVFQASH